MQENAPAKINVNELFQRITQFCSLPFPRLEPPKIVLKEPDNSICELQRLQNLLKGGPIKIGKKNENTQTICPKTAVEVENLFREIGDYCQIKLPFRLNDLHEIDGPASNNTETQITKLSTKCRTLRSRRSVNKNDLQNHSFANLMFNNFNKNSAPERTKEKFKNPTKDKSSKKSKRNFPNQNIKSVSVPYPEPPIFPAPNINFGSLINIKNSILSCRNYLNTIKNEETQIEDSNTHKKKKVRNSKADKLLCKDDSVESGYSSSQSSVHSPTCSLPSIDSDLINRSNFSSSSSAENSFVHNINPNGEVVYFRSQYHSFLNKTLKRKLNPKSARCVMKFNRPDEIDHHQKVIEWQSRTLQSNSCPTPQHDHFGDTPPPSPRNPATLQIPQDMINSNSANDLLDLDCLQNFCDTGWEHQEEASELDLILLQASREHDLEADLNFCDSFNCS